MKFAAWISMALMVGIAVNVPLVLFGASRSTLLIVDFVLAGLWLLNRDSALETFFTRLWVYGFVFAMWSILGLIVVIVLALLSFDIHMPLSAFVIAGVGLFGVLREISKSPSES